MARGSQRAARPSGPDAQLAAVQFQQSDRPPVGCRRWHGPGTGLGCRFPGCRQTCVPAVVEHAVYVDAPAANRGVGRALLTALIDSTGRRDVDDPVRGCSGKRTQFGMKSAVGLSRHRDSRTRGRAPRAMTSCGADRTPEHDRRPIGRRRRRARNGVPTGAVRGRRSRCGPSGRATYASPTLQRAVGVHGTSTRQIAMIHRAGSFCLCVPLAPHQPKASNRAPGTTPPMTSIHACAAPANTRINPTTPQAVTATPSQLKNGA